MTRLRAAFAFTAAVLRTLLRDRQSLFFMMVLPVVVIVVIGTTFGGEQRVEIGVVAPDGSQIAEALISELEASPAFEIHRVADRDALASQIRRRTIDAGLYLSNDVVPIEVLTTPDQDVVTIRSAVSGVVDQLSIRLTAARFAATQSGATAEQAAAAVEAVALQPTAVVVTDVGGAQTRTLSDFSLTVPQNLVLFTFINATASASFLVRSKREGVLRRALASPTGLGTHLAGLAIGWFVVALMQSLIIVFVGWAAFGMDWGDPFAATALVTLWALVGCGAGLLVGAIGSNEDRVGAMAPVVGLVLGAFGGCMVPPEVFSDTMRKVALAVPHTWALNGWQNVVFDGGDLADISGSIAVLAAWAVGLLSLATVLLRRRLATSGST